MGLFGNSNATATARLHQLALTQSVNGIVVPIIYGTNRAQLNLLDYMDFTSTKESAGGKGFGGKGGTVYDYHATILGVICEGEIAGIGNVWGTNGRLTGTVATESVGLAGMFTYVAAETFAIDHGCSLTEAYSFLANDFGSPGAQTLSGTQSVPLTRVSGSPGPGQYSVSPTGLYTFNSADVGKTVTVSYKFSLYTLEATEDYNVPNNSPYTITVTNQPSFSSDAGVIDVNTLQVFTKVGGTPTVSGTYNPNGGNYLFAAADANRAVAISYNWKQNNSNVDSSATLAFSVIEGSQSQSPWSYLTSTHKSRSLGYSGMALIGAVNMDLGASGSMPMYNYEVSGPYRFGGGIVDAEVASCIIDLLTHPLHGAEFDGVLDDSLTGTARNYWNSNGFFISPVLDSQRSAAEIIGEWCEAGNVAPLWSEGKLKFIPYGDRTTIANGYTYTPQDGPQVDLTDDDFLDRGGEDPVTIERTPWQDAYNSVKVEYRNRVNNYNPDVIEEQNTYAIERFGLRQEGQKSYSFITSPEVAAFSANLRLKRLVYIRNQYHFVLSGIRYGWLEPMDLVTLTDQALGLFKVPVRLTAITENENMELECTAEEFPWGTATATISPKQEIKAYEPVGAATDPGNTSAVIFEAPNRLAKYQGNILYLFLNGGANWGGCDVYVSFNGTKYEKFGEAGQASRIGALASGLPAFAGTNPDTGNTLTVNMQEGAQLLSVDSSDASNLVSLAAIVNSLNEIELLSYENATLVGPNQYALTNLYRNVYGTGPVAHSAGEMFARLDQASLTYQYDSTYYGRTIYFKFVSFNSFKQNYQNLADVPAYSFTLQGVGPGAIDLNTGNLKTAQPAYTAYRPLTNPITAHDAGTSATINLAAVQMRLVGFGDISLSLGAISGVAYNTLYYIYYDDPDCAGGAVAYQATTVKETALEGISRFYLGSITTPRQGAPDTIGNNDGGSGAQSGMVNVLQMSVVNVIYDTTQAPYVHPTGNTGSVSNEQNAIDGDLTSCCSLSATGSPVSHGTAILLLTGPAGIARRFQSMKLKIMVSASASGPNGSVVVGTMNDYVSTAITNYSYPDNVLSSIDGTGGTLPTTWTTSTLPLTTFTVDLPQDINPALVAVSVIVQAGGPAGGNASANVYGAWIEATE